MSACIGMMNSKSMKETQFSFDSQNNFTLGDKRRQFRLQQRSNSQVFVPIKKEEEFLISNLNEDNNIIKINDKIKNNDKNQEREKTINNSYIFDNKIKKLKLRGKSNVCTLLIFSNKLTLLFFITSSHFSFFLLTLINSSS